MSKIQRGIFLLLLSSTIASSGSFYMGGGLGLTRANTYTVEKESMVDLNVKFGYEINEWIDLEGRGSFYLFGGDKLYHPSSMGIFLKPNYDLVKKINIYGVIGYSRNTLTLQDTNQINAVTIQDDLSYGGGVEYEIVENIYGNVDYIQYIDKSTTKPEGKYAIKVDSLSMGLVYKFGKRAQKNKIGNDSSVHILQTVTKSNKIKKVYKTIEFPEYTVFDDMDEE